MKLDLGFLLAENSFLVFLGFFLYVCFATCCHLGLLPPIPPPHF
jgi:hypothetical protein